jgi:hypothetical protein
MRSWRENRVWRRRRGGRGSGWPAALCIALILGCGIGQSRADDTQNAVQSAVDSDQIQRRAPLPDEMRKSVQEAERQPDIQRNPPETKPVEVPDRPVARVDLGWLPYLIIGAIVLGLLFLIARHVTFRAGLRAADRDRPRAKGTTSYGLALDGDAARDHTFDEVDALAAQGAFSEAIHRLLLLVQERLRSRIEHGLQASLTSREILRRAKLPSEASTAFAGLVAAVEITLFGRQVANRATYQLCREHSQRVLSAAAG